MVDFSDYMRGLSDLSVIRELINLNDHINKNPIVPLTCCRKEFVGEDIIKHFWTHYPIQASEWEKYYKDDK